MIYITIIKWLFIVGAIWFSFYLYSSENRKIHKLSKYVADKNVLNGLRRSSRRKMLHLLIIFTAFIVWMMSYDFIVEEVTQENANLTKKLSETSKIYENLTESQVRLIEAQNNGTDFSADIKEFYKEVFFNYYVMKKCDLTGQDDVFIINTAMTREMRLNKVSTNLSEDIISSARTEFSQSFINYDCSAIKGEHNDIIDNYSNYIVATRAVLKSTF